MDNAIRKYLECSHARIILRNLATVIVLALTFAPIYAQMVDPDTPANALPVSGGVAWELEFSDEFNGNNLDTSKWGIDVSTKSRNGRASQGIDDWWWKSQNVSLDGNGNLKLDVVKHDSNTMYCGSVSSDGLYEPTYGYLEARIQIADTTKSTHTAFWLQGASMLTNDADGTAWDGAEVDIFESAWFGDYTKAVVHIDGYGANKRASTKQYSTPGLHNGFHVFGLEWTADYMKIYYDGVLKVTYSGTWVPRVQEWLWLSVGASFGDVGTFTSEQNGVLTSAYFDYVRVWKAVPTYTVNYNGNGNTGGSVPVDANTYLTGATATVLGNTGNLTKFAHTFAGWNAAADGSGTGYSPSDPFVMGTSDVTLFAQWNTATSYPLSVVDGSGDGNYAEGDVVPITANAPPQSYRFIGWTTSDGGVIADANAMTTTYTMPANSATVTVNYVLNIAPVVNAGPDQTVYLTPGSPWTPADISTDAWFDASDVSTITETGGGVSQWSDKSGNNRHIVQGNASMRPTFSSTDWNGSLPSITFDGTDDYLENSTNFSQPTVTIAAVFEQATTSNQDRIFGFRGSAASTKVNFGLACDNSLRYDGAKSDQINVSPTLGKHLRVATRGTGTQTDHTDGTPNINSSLILPNVDGYLNVGACGASLTLFCPGKVSEAVAIYGTVTDEIRQKVEGYLAHKWGLEGNLPAGHPYKSSPPGGTSATANLSGTVSDDDGDLLVTTWSVVGGPASVYIADPAAVNTTATFTVEGVYTLRLTADDGVDQTSNDIVITVGTGGGAILDVNLPPGISLYGYTGANAIDAQAAFQTLIDTSQLSLVRWVNPANGQIKELYYTTFPSAAWINEIGDMTLGQGFVVKTTAACTLSIAGNKDTTNVSHSLPAGYSLLGFNRETPMNAQTAFQELIDAGELEVVRWVDPSNGAIKELYYTTFPSSGWVNEIGNLTEGQGYIIKLNAAHSGFSLP